MKQRFFRGQQFFQILFLRAVFFPVNPVCFRLVFVPLPLKDARIACAIFRAENPVFAGPQSICLFVTIVRPEGYGI